MNPILAIVATATYQRVTSLIAWCLLVSGSDLDAPVVQQGRTPDLYSGGVGSIPAGGSLLGEVEG